MDHSILPFVAMSRASALLYHLVATKLGADETCFLSARLVTINNVFDTYCDEKKGYPSMGAAFTVKYRVGS
jgi:hypothetical protein